MVFVIIIIEERNFIIISRFILLVYCDYFNYCVVDDFFFWIIKN